MSAIGVVVLVAGITVTVLTMAGMLLLTERGTVAVHAEGSDGQGSNLSPTTAPAAPTEVAAGS